MQSSAGDGVSYDDEDDAIQKYKSEWETHLQSSQNDNSASNIWDMSYVRRLRNDSNRMLGLEQKKWNWRKMKDKKMWRKKANIIILKYSFSAERWWIWVTYKGSALLVFFDFDFTHASLILYYTRGGVYKWKSLERMARVNSE